MIDSLTLKDWECHADFTVEFGRCTSFVGPSDAGKSSILRGLRWALTNQPPGDSFVRHGRANAEVTVRGNGKRVGRLRGAKGNLYALGKRAFRAFGAGVPQPIADLFNVSDLNFQGPSDPPFWLSLPPAQLAKEFNRVVNLEEIDAALDDIGSRERHAKAVVGVSKERLAQARGKRNSLKWVADLNAQLNKVEVVYKKYQEAGDRQERLEELLAAIDRSERSRDDALTRSRTLSSVAEAAAGVNAQQGRLEALGAILDEIGRLRRVRGVELPDLEPVYRRYAELTQRKRGVETILAGIETLEFSRCAAESELAKVEEALEGVCPACGRPFTQSASSPATGTYPTTPPPCGAKHVRTGITPKKTTSNS